MTTVNKSLLNYAVSDLRAKGKIDVDTETSLETYIGNISKQTYSILGYSEFDQVTSTDWTYTDASRIATNSSGDAATLATNSQSLTNCTLKGILVDTNNAITLFEISIDGTTFFSVDQFNSNEDLSATTKFRITMANGSVVSNMMIIYDKNES